jgi:hypothetical protein
MKTGIIPDEPFADYLAADAVGSGRLEDLTPRPLVYFKRWVARTLPPRKSTPAFDFGRLFHCLALEGEDTMAARFVVVPADAPDDLRRFRDSKKKSPATIESIAWWDAFEAQTAGKEVVTQADIDLAWKMVGAIRENPEAVEILSRGKPEVTFRHKLPAFAVQARVDWFDKDDPAGPLLVNVKTIDSLDDFDKQFHDFAYYKGDAFYRLVVAKVLGVEPFVPQCLDLVVEKNEPFECEIRVPDAEAIAIGAGEVMKDLQLLARCYESGVWPGASRARRAVSLPEWKVRQAMKEAA